MTYQNTLFTLGLLLLLSLMSCAKKASEQQETDTSASTESAPEEMVMVRVGQTGAYPEGVVVAEPAPGKRVRPTDDWEIGIPDSPQHSRSRSGTWPLVKQSEIQNSVAFQQTQDTPLSTFSIDVDTASYSLLRTAIKEDWSIPRHMVRLEEMVNYFEYLYPKPVDDPIAIHAEAGKCPWNDNHHLLLVGLQTENPFQNQTELPPSNYVFLIDVSGSMSSLNKLPLLQTGLKKLAATLRPEDQVSIVTYANHDRIVTEGVSGHEKAQLIALIDELSAGGSTAGSDGLLSAYEVAHRNFIPNGNNRIILATDGDFNIGASSEKDLVELIEEQRDAGIFLTILGFGMSYRSEARMEALSNHGDGNYFLIDTEREADRVLVSRLHSNLHTLAKDVKVQVAFNPTAIQSYRLLGYRNRKLATEDFEDDRKDAGEIGPDQQVTALYEVVLNSDIDSLLQTDLATVGIRYKNPEEDMSHHLEYVVEGTAFNKSADNLKVAASVAALGLYLQADPNLDGDPLPVIQKNLEPYLDSPERNELYQLIETLRQRE
jgi:Ca-activated chloride channel family protein